MFQYDFGPPKHVLHLVWSVLGISTAIKTALKVALYEFFDGPLAPLNGQFMEKVNPYNRVTWELCQCKTPSSNNCLTAVTT